MAVDAEKPNLTVLLPTMREAGNLPWLFQRLKEELAPVVSELEILVVDKPTDDGTEAICREHGATYVGKDLGFADALKFGFRTARHELIVTMDADGSHDPAYIRWMLKEIPNCDLVIGSRYAPRGAQETTWFRYVTSRILNIWVGTVCSMPILDLSGGFKLYRKAIFEAFEIESHGFEIQCEIAIKTYGHGFRIREIPFCYHPRMEGRSKAAIIKYGLAFLFGSLRLRRYRNSREFCDYDERAYRSRWPFQRLWQRRRYARIKAMLKPEGRCLDLGCGSSQLVLGFSNVTGVDCNPSIVRYLRNEDRDVVQASAEALPFDDAAFARIYCCEVAEYLDADSKIFAEAARVLRPGGRLLVTTPDYGGICWPIVKSIYKLFLSNPKGHEHQTCYTKAKMQEKFESQGLRVVGADRIFGSILFLLFEKPAGGGR